MGVKYGISLCCVVCGHNTFVMPATSLLAANETLKDIRKQGRPPMCPNCNLQLVYFPCSNEEE